MTGLETIKEKDITVDEILKRIDQGDSFTTSQPAPTEFLDLYETAINEEKASHIYVVGLSSRISGTYQSAVLAKSMLNDEDVVTVFDTMLAAYGTEMIALRLIELVENNTPHEKLVKDMNDYIKNAGQMFVPENLMSLSKGGRLKASSAIVGSILRIKPIIKVIDGKLELNHKTRSLRKANEYMIDTLKESYKSNEQLFVYITDTHSTESGDLLESMLKDAFPDAIVNRTSYLGPVFSVHVGKKGYGFSWCFR
jgi:DegV family protein with EDD domain